MSNSALDVFSSPLIQTNVVGEQILDLHPITPIVQGQTVQFDVPPSFTQMTDPNMLLNVAVKIKNADGTDIVNDAEVAPTNLLLHAMFKDIICKANDSIINQATGAYGYKSYIETNYTYSP